MRHGLCSYCLFILSMHMCGFILSIKSEFALYILFCILLLLTLTVNIFHFDKICSRTLRHLSIFSLSSLLTLTHIGDYFSFVISDLVDFFSSSCLEKIVGVKLLTLRPHQNQFLILSFLCAF